MVKRAICSLLLCFSLTALANSNTNNDWTRVADPEQESHWWAQISGDLIRQLREHPEFKRRGKVSVINDVSGFNLKLTIDLWKLKYLKEVDSNTPPDLVYEFQEIGDGLILTFNYEGWEYTRRYRFNLPNIQSINEWEVKVLSK